MKANIINTKSLMFLCLSLVTFFLACKQDEQVEVANYETRLDQYLYLVDEINVKDVFYKQKITFDSIVTYAGKRVYEAKGKQKSRKDKIKLKLWYKDNWVRGYYNMHYNTTNLQVYGSNKDGILAIKSASGLDSQEGSSYFLGKMLRSGYTGVAGTPELNEKGKFTFEKSELDYYELLDW